MPVRQVVFFTIACWAAMGLAVLHLAGHIAGPPSPANDTERQLLELATTYRIPMAGGAERTFMDLLSGFSLTFSVFLAFLGGSGLMVKRRCRDDGPMMRAFAGAAGAAGAVMVGISLVHWFIVPSVALAIVAFGFLFAAVRPPEPGPAG